MLLVLILALAALAAAIEAAALGQEDLGTGMGTTH